MVAIEDFEMPESCFRCTKRKCLHIDGKAYQMCGLNEDGYLTESWFNSENIPKSCRSAHCPLEEVEAIPKADYENRLKADMVAMLTEIQLEIEEKSIIDYDEDLYDGGECVISISEINEIIQEKINKLKGAEDGKID